MESLPNIPESFLPKFEQLWASACRVCDSILEFKPDLVLSLMHSGWTPVFAAQIIWQKTQAKPFPTTVKTNIGREKLESFDKSFNFYYTTCFVGKYSSTLDIGNFLAWLKNRTDWQEQLRQQIEDAMYSSAEPQRILVVDEFVMDGATSILTPGLLKYVYPRAEVRFLNSDSVEFAYYKDFMLEVLCPPGDLFQDSQVDTREMREYLNRVAQGTESIDEQSLYWSPISEESICVRALSPFLPPAEWLKMSGKIYGIIEDYIAGLAPSYTPSNLEPHYYESGPGTEDFLMRDIWLEGEITPREAKKRYGLSDRELDEIIWSWIVYDQAEVTGHGRGTRYIIPPNLQKYLTRSGPRPYDPWDAYWVVPGKLMFGEDLYDTDSEELSESERKDIHRLLDLGIDCWLDVQALMDGESPGENKFFSKETRALGKPVIIRTIPLEIMYCDAQGSPRTKRRRPNRKDIRPILDQIDQLLADGRIIYVCTPYRDLRGIIAGCYLARHGQVGSAALKVLRDRRATSVQSWRRDPISNRARRFVRSWPAGM